MREKVLCLIVFLVFVLPAYSQEIITDRIENDGSWQLMCSSFKVKLTGQEYDAEYSFCIKAYKWYNHVSWCIVVSSFFLIPEDAVILIKLKNDDVLKFNINNLHIGKIHRGGYSYTIGSITYNNPSRDDDYYTSLYDVTESQLKQMSDYGIAKIRISAARSYREKVWKKDKLGRFFYHSACLIKKKYEEGRQQPTSIYDNF